MDCPFANPGFLEYSLHMVTAIEQLVERADPLPANFRARLANPIVGRPMRYFVPLLLCVLAVSCTRSSYYNLDTWAKPHVPAAAQSAESDDDIRETVFRYRMAHNESYQAEKAHAYYLAVEGGLDPSDEFMKRFSRSATPVRKKSASTTGPGIPLAVSNNESGLPGLIFTFDSLERTGATQADVVSGYFEGERGSTGITNRLEFKNGRWVVLE